MSSISSNDRRRTDDRVRQTREEYENREAENNKKKNAEIQKLQERHRREIDNISANYEQRIEDIKGNAREAMSDRDVANSRKIDEVRQVYREALRKKSDESNSMRDNMRTNYESTIEGQRRVSEEQKNNLLNQMNEEIQMREERYAENSRATNSKAQESSKNNTERLNKNHEAKERALVDSHRTVLENKNRTHKEVVKDFENQVQKLERKNEGDNSKWSQKYTDYVKNSSEQYSDNLDIKNEIMNQERRAIKDKFETKLAEKQGQIDEQFDDFSRNLSDRMDRQVRSKDSQISGLNSKLNHEISKSERLRAMDRKHLTETYEKQLKMSEENRLESIDQMRSANGQRVSKVIGENQKLMRNMERDSQSKAQMTLERHRNEREYTQTQHKDQMAHVMSSSDERVDRMKGIALKNNEQMAKYYDESLEVMRNNYTAKIEEVRDKNQQEQQTLNKVMTERFRSMEESFNAKLNETVKRYEQKIVDLEDSQKRELKRMENTYQSRMGDSQKAGKTEKESIQMKYEAKMAQLANSHEQQIERMNRRHEEDMQNLAMKVGNYSRKA